MISRRVTAVFVNDPHTSAWEGDCEENGIIHFDFTNKRGPRRFFVMPEYCVMFADESHLPMKVAKWFVHLVDAAPYDADPSIWLIRDCEIDVLVSKDPRSYRMVDLDDFAQALTDGTISIPDAQRLLPVLQRFIDTHLHTGDFPPPEVRPWLTPPTMILVVFRSAHYRRTCLTAEDDRTPAVIVRWGSEIISRQGMKSDERTTP